jgi:hypothetical protein
MTNSILIPFLALFCGSFTFSIFKYSQRRQVSPRVLKAEMTKAFKKILIPELRKSGFSGSFPHFRLLEKDLARLLVVQFNRHGGSFVLEFSNLPIPCADLSRRQIPIEKLEVYDAPSKFRRRLGSSDERSDGKWFVYEKFKSNSRQSFEILAREAVQMLRSEKVI